MSTAIFRFVAVIVLALAVPLQGFAAVAAGQCMALGHHDAPASPQHSHHMDGDGPDHSHADESKTSHCGPCTACCASASIAAPAAVTLLPVPTNIKYVFSQLAPHDAEPHRFDRPPLSL